MQSKLTEEERDWLSRLDTDSVVKPDVPVAVGERLVEQGLAIKLVEGGYQLTALGREYLNRDREKS
jgi:hypothetical protein